MFDFYLTRKCRQTAARTGVFRTPHGKFQTPAFMPVGTFGVVKTVCPTELKAAGAEIILANAFHLFLRPGLDTIQRCGGLRQFMRYAGPILTDSGGFQVFSLARFRKVFADRVEFQSPFDGSKHVLTPQKMLQIQQALGVTLAMQLDECVPGAASRAVTEQALTRTQRWAEVSFRLAQKFKNVEGPMVLPIVQGGRFLDLRRRAVDYSAGLPTNGIALGGLAVGESKLDFARVLAATGPRLPERKLRYLMGVGEPADILLAVQSGIDLFDCVLPTRLARHGVFFEQAGRKVSLKLARFRGARAVLQPGCPCPACCGNFSRAYLRHLLVVREPLGARLLTWHNLTWILGFMREIRRQIRAGSLKEFARAFG